MTLPGERFEGWSVVDEARPEQLLFSLSPSQLVAFLSGASVIAEDPDSGAVLVVDWFDGAVASFLFNDVSPADPAPADFVIEARSLNELARSPWPAAKPSALERRYRRAIWLAQLFHGDDWVCDDSVDDVRRAMRDAATDDAWREERALLSTRDDLAAYWLLAHAVRGDSTALNEALAATRETTSPAVVSIRQQVAALVERFLAARPDWSADDFASLRD